MSKLCKEICKKCINKCAMQESRPPDFFWREITDEYWWEVGVVYCPAEMWNDVKIFDPPESCPYKFEQTVLSEKPE